MDDLQEHIRNMIIDRDYDEYGFLPSEGELSKKYQVSHATIREAVRAMEVRGLLKRIHGKGIMVVNNGSEVVSRTIRDILDTQQVSLDDLMEVRKMLEVQAAELAAERADEEDIRKMRQYIEDMRNADVLDKAYLENDFAFHLQVVTATKNLLLIIITQAYNPYLMQIIRHSTTTKYNIEVKKQYHQRILECIENRDKRGAARCMREHLKVTVKNWERYKSKGVV